MARQQRNDVDYFPHDVVHGKKMYYIEKKYKNDGYAVWHKLLEELGKADYHYLDINSEVSIMFLSGMFNVSEITLNQIIEDLVRLEVFDKELFEYGILFNQKFNDSIEDAYKKRTNNIITRNELVILLTAKGIIKPDKSNPYLDKSVSKGYGNPQSKEDYIIPEEIKENNIKEEVAEKNSAYPDCMKIYNDFIIQKTGVNAKIDGLTGKSLKKIISYLESNVKAKEDGSIDVTNAFKFIFEKYESWDKFHQQQLKLNQIESNLINIINNIRNGTRKSISDKTDALRSFGEQSERLFQESANKNSGRSDI